MKKYLILAGGLIFISLLQVPRLFAQDEAVFPAWKAGLLDIHHINTGRGVATFFLLPDGTTLLIDAGATERARDARLAAAKPDDSRSPGDWITRYITYMHLPGSRPTLDYLLLTHFDTDHMGGLYKGNSRHLSGDFVLTGVTEVGSKLKVAKIIDRGWPDYAWPRPLKQPHINNYKRFLKWHIEQNKGTVEQLQVGRENQLVLMHAPTQYPHFKIRNVAANGTVWTGRGVETASNIPDIALLKPEEYPSENMTSIALKLTYGKFDYFIGGDITGVPVGGWQDIETPVADAVGRVDVNVVNHHGYFDTQNEYFLRKLQPQTHIIQSWAVSHPSPGTLNRLLSTKLYPGTRHVFATNTMETTKVFIGSAINQLKSQQGHIVIRVDPDGITYRVYILEDNDETYRVKAVFGPYTAL